jgi:hypothetical protein
LCILLRQVSRSVVVGIKLYVYVVSTKVSCSKNLVVLVWKM